MQLYEELQARGLIAQVTDEKLIADLINQGKACRTFYGIMSDEAVTDGRKQTDCPDRRRDRHDWGSVRKNGYAADDDTGDHSA